MSIEKLTIGEPFFPISLIEDEASFQIHGRCILLNLGVHPIQILDQNLGHLQSVIVSDVTVQNVSKAVLIERFDAHEDDDVLFEEVRKVWPSAYEVRKEERLRGVSHYMSPKVWHDRTGFTLYHSGSVPLKVGLHKEHPFCPVPGFREVHMQIVGFGRMQQCREKDVDTLYVEEYMAPGHTHRPMYDAQGNYPWHQFETLTPSIFMAVEMLPEGATPPEAKS